MCCVFHCFHWVSTRIRIRKIVDFVFSFSSLFIYICFEFKNDFPLFLLYKVCSFVLFKKNSPHTNTVKHIVRIFMPRHIFIRTMYCQNRKQILYLLLKQKEQNQKIKKSKKQTNINLLITEMRKVLVVEQNWNMLNQCT